MDVTRQESEEGMVKGNVSWRRPLSARWLAAGVATALVALQLAIVFHDALPSPRDPNTASPTDFVAETAHKHLRELTALGPRVAGSYENEVAAVAVLVAAVKQAARAASPHNTVEMDLHRASGAFPLDFFDGMNNMYRDVQSLVVRVGAAGGGGAAEPALLLNCHFDTVPGSPVFRLEAEATTGILRVIRDAAITAHQEDEDIALPPFYPNVMITELLVGATAWRLSRKLRWNGISIKAGASDDGAGCAVLLEVLRALAATPRPLRHRAVFLFNGAEENILQASHAFVTQHHWARTLKAFINIEACGAGGREVLFQAGPQQPWLLDTYAAVAPRPYASSVAQELFHSGLVPADTDFRIFRDFGNLSGLDFAWSSNGYVYHTALDTAAHVSLPALQHTGDNVLALTHGLLASEKLGVSDAGGQPVFFDVVGLVVVTAHSGAAVAAVLATLLLQLLQARADAAGARRTMYVSGWAWLRALLASGACVTAAVCAGLGAAAAAGAVTAAGGGMAYYSRPWLLAPLYALPAVSVSWLVLRRLMLHVHIGGVPARGSSPARLVAAALGAGWTTLMLLCAARGIRSGFVAAQWALLPALASQPAYLLRASEGWRLLLWTLGSSLPLLQTWYLALGSLTMFVPITGRAGTAPLPPDVMLALLTAALSLAACSWLLPVSLAARGAARLARAALVVTLITMVLVATTPLGRAYSELRPQRYMVFHTRRSTHLPGGDVTHEDLYWLPHLDANTPHSLRGHVDEIAYARDGSSSCQDWPYCGAPYCLPVLALVGRGYWLPAAAPPPVEVTVTVAAWTQRVDDNTQALRLTVTGPSHVVVIVSPAAGATISWLSTVGGPPTEAAPFGDRRTYFLTLHDALRPREWNITMHIQHSFSSPPAQWARLSVAGHGMSLPLAAQHQRLLHRMPAWTAATGWPVQLHLLDV